MPPTKRIKLGPSVVSRVSAWYTVDRESLSEPERQRVFKDLTVAAKPNPMAGPNAEKVCRLYVDDAEESTLLVPRFYGKRRFGEPEVNDSVRGTVRDSMWFSGHLDDSRKQNEAATAVMDSMDDPERLPAGGVLVMACGMGKTCVALFLACHYAVRTLIIVPTTVLAEQWMERIHAFCPRSTVQLLSGAHDEGACRPLMDGDFVVATIQTMSMCAIHVSLLQSFGFTIIDEAHGLCAPTFCKASQHVHSSRVLALSATPERSDGLHAGMPLMLGPILFRVARPTPLIKPLVRAVGYRNPTREIASRGPGGRKQPRVAAMITAMAADACRTEVIAGLLQELRREGREILVLSERVQLLHDIADHLPEDERGVLTGKTKKGDRATATLRPVVLASYGLCREGFDKACLDTLVMATPITNIEQSVGRILRGASSNRPLIVDICDSVSLFPAYASKRRRFYAKEGFETSAERAQPPAALAVERVV